MKTIATIAWLEWTIAWRPKTTNGPEIRISTNPLNKTDGRDNVSWGGFINRNTRNYQISQSIAGIGEDFNADLGFVRRKGNFRNFTKYTQKFYPKTGAINTWNLTLTKLFIVEALG